jgi:hypothetical protein
MGMSNKQLLTMGRLAESNKDLTDAINSKAGKEFMAEQDKLLKLIDDKKRLDNIDAAEVVSEKKRARIVASGEEEKRRIIRLAEDEIKGRMQELGRKELDLAKSLDGLNEQKKTYNLNVAEYESKVRAINDREGMVDSRYAALERAETKLKTQENDIARREEKVRNYEAWFATRPG